MLVSVRVFAFSLEVSATDQACIHIGIGKTDGADLFEVKIKKMAFNGAEEGGGIGFHGLITRGYIENYKRELTAMSLHRAILLLL